VRSPRRLALAVALALVAVLVLAAAPAGAARSPSPPSPGSAGLGDRIFPGLGNGGYDVRHYHLDLRYETSAPNQPIDGTVTIVARSTQALSRFNLDFAGQSVGAVSVNHRAADWTREGEELVITPKRPLRNHRIFVVEVANFTAVPTEPNPEDFSTSRSSSRRTGRPLRRSPTSHTASSRATTTHATRRASRSASMCRPTGSRLPTACRRDSVRRAIAQSGPTCSVSPWLRS
jgi:hypothetical protein